MLLDKRDALLPITDRGRGLIAVSVIFSVTTVLCVALRMVRNVKFRKYGWDEVLIVAAMILQLATNGLSIASVAFGNGRHIRDFPDLRNSFLAVELPWISQPLSTATLMIAKISLGATLLTIGLGRKFNIIVIVTLLVVGVADIWSIVMILAGCRPTRDPGAGPCGASDLARGVGFFQCVANVLTDVIFFAAPEYFLRQTKLSSRDRMVIRLLLGCMFLATIMSILKIVYLQILLTSGDVTWFSVPVTASSVAESGVSILAACLPAIRQLAGQRFPKHFAFWKKTGSHGTVSSQGTVNHKNNPTKIADPERGVSPDDFGPPYAVRDMRMKHENYDLDEDEDGVELIKITPKTADATLAIDSNVTPRANKSDSVRTMSPDALSPGLDDPATSIYHSLDEHQSSHLDTASTRTSDNAQDSESIRNKRISIPDDSNKIAYRPAEPEEKIAYKPDVVHSRSTSAQSYTDDKIVTNPPVRSSSRSSSLVRQAYPNTTRYSLSRTQSDEDGTVARRDYVHVGTSHELDSASRASRASGLGEDVGTGTGDENNLAFLPPFYYDKGKVRRNSRESAENYLQQHQREMSRSRSRSTTPTGHHPPTTMSRFFKR